MKMISQADLQEVFEIVDGELWRKEYVRSDGQRSKRKLVKNVANSSKGYCDVRLKGRVERYHRIVWELLNGDIPGGMQIDHIDGDRINNNVNNLRLVTNRENHQNQVIHRNGRLFGCYYNKQSRKWQASVRVNGKKKYLGSYDTEQEAHDAYKKFIQKRGVA